jgi:Protein of unknown function (DUF2849)
MKPDKKTASKVLTANRLNDGISVWFTGGDWSMNVNDALVAADAEAVATLDTVSAKALADGQYCDVVLIDVEQTPNGVQPSKLRERIRAFGPTITYDTGSFAANCDTHSTAANVKPA